MKKLYLIFIIAFLGYLTTLTDTQFQYFPGNVKVKGSLLLTGDSSKVWVHDVVLVYNATTHSYDTLGTNVNATKFKGCVLIDSLEFSRLNGSYGGTIQQQLDSLAYNPVFTGILRNTGDMDLRSNSGGIELNYNSGSSDLHFWGGNTSVDFSVTGGGNGYFAGKVNSVSGYQTNGYDGVLVNSIGALTASGIYVAESSGGSPIRQLYYKTLTLSNGSSVNILCTEIP